MADKKQSKEYSAGNGKRWLFGFGFLALVAIIIVIIVISIPANPNTAMQLLNKASTNSFMMSQTEKTNFDGFELKVANAQKVNNYLVVMPQEMEDVETLSITLAQVLEHYNDYIIFATNNNALNKNYKNIKSGLNKAKDNQKQLNLIISEVNKLSDQSSTHLQNAWIDFREEYAQWLNNYQKAIEALKNAYKDGLGDVTTNNLASTIILNTVCDYVDVISDDFDALVKFDNENPNANVYEYKSKGKITGFAQFVDKYLINDADIVDYYFNSIIKEKYKKIDNYFELYAETDMKNAISSMQYISDKPVVTKTYSGVEDGENVFVSVKVFLVGGAL